MFDPFTRDKALKAIPQAGHVLSNPEQGGVEEEGKDHKNMFSLHTGFSSTGAHSE